MAPAPPVTGDTLAADAVVRPNTPITSTMTVASVKTRVRRVHKYLERCTASPPNSLLPGTIPRVTLLGGRAQGKRSRDLYRQRRSAGSHEPSSDRRPVV